MGVSTGAKRILIGAALGIACATPSTASPLGFDCDVPAGRLASVSENVQGPKQAVSGSISVEEMRSGKFLPVAGARIDSADSQQGFGFQLAAASSHAEQLDIILNTKRGQNVTRNTLGQISASGAISFNLAISEAGKITLLIGNSRFMADFVPFASAKVMAFCSSGQFMFSALAMSGESPVAP